VIRNLVSHRALEKRGLATYRKGEALTRGSYVLTDLGKASVKASWARRLK
jgi:DNA-binding PadR family transcriptional regulator